MKLIEIEGVRQYTTLLHTLVTKGEVVTSGLAIRLPRVRRIVASALEWRVMLSSPHGLTIARDNLGLVRSINPEIERDTCPQLWDLIVDGYVKFGPVGIRAKEPNPSLVLDDAGEFVRIRCTNTVLELDYPGWADPDIDEIQLWPDRAVIVKTGVDVEITFV